MAIDQILVKIMDQANLEAKTVLDNASRESDVILEEAKKEADSIKESIIADCKQANEFAFRKEVISKKLNSQKAVLAEKKDQVESCFQSALNSLCTLQDDVYNKLLTAMFSKLELKEDCEVVTSKKDASKITKDFIKKANPAINVVKFSQDDNLKGGFIIKSNELIIDNSIETMLNDSKLKIESNVASILFKELN